MKRADEALDKQYLKGIVYFIHPPQVVPNLYDFFLPCNMKWQIYEVFTQVFCIQYIVPTSDTFATKDKRAQ